MIVEQVLFALAVVGAFVGFGMWWEEKKKRETLEEEARRNREREQERKP